MATVVNNSQRIIILSARLPSAKGDTLGAGSKKLYLQPGINFVESDDLKLMSKSYIDAHVDKGNLTVSYDKIDKSVKADKSKQAKKVKDEKPEAKKSEDLSSELDEIDLLD